MFRSFSFYTAALVVCALPAGAAAVQQQDFIDFAGSHCRAFVSEGRADLGFAMGKAGAKFSQAELLAFNRAFAAKLIDEYDIDPTQGCTMDALTVKPVSDSSSRPSPRGRHVLPKASREIAVVSGALASRNSTAPVSVSYRLERVGESPWAITNISFNGQPLADRYRERYEALAQQGGAQAVLDNL